MRFDDEHPLSSRAYGRAIGGFAVLVVGLIAVIVIGALLRAL